MTAMATATCARCGAAPGAPCRYPSPTDSRLPGTVWTGRLARRAHPGRTTPRATPTTTCQICARPIEANTGVIAHHGYKRPGNGWQTASCFGARRLPYEVSCDAIPEAIESALRYVAEEEKALQRFHDAPPETLVELQYLGWRGPGERPVLRRPDSFDPDHLPVSFRGDQRYELRYVNLRSEMRGWITRAKSDIKFLRARLAAWRPQ